MVAPFVGAWIEISETLDAYNYLKVAPFVGAWIEMQYLSFIFFIILSPLLWGRGLKSLCCNTRQELLLVAPFVGAWIEIIRFYVDIVTAYVAPFVGAWIEIYAV